MFQTGGILIRYTISIYSYWEVDSIEVHTLYKPRLSHAGAAGDTALIHAVEVHGSEAQLRLLGQEDDVVGFEIAPVGSQVYWSRPPLVDAATGQTATAAGTGTTGITGTSQELYDRLSTLAER